MAAAQDKNPPVVQPEIDDNNDADSLLQSVGGLLFSTSVLVLNGLF